MIHQFKIKSIQQIFILVLKRKINYIHKRYNKIDKINRNDPISRLNIIRDDVQGERYNFNDRIRNKKKPKNIYHSRIIRTIVSGREFDFDTQINACSASTVKLDSRLIIIFLFSLFPSCSSLLVRAVRQSPILICANNTIVNPPGERLEKATGVGRVSLCRHNANNSRTVSGE